MSISTVVDFPAPFGPEEAVDLARRDGQVDPVDRARPFLELPDERLGLDRVLVPHAGQSTNRVGVWRRVHSSPEAARCAG